MMKAQHNCIKPLLAKPIRSTRMLIAHWAVAIVLTVSQTSWAGHGSREVLPINTPDAKAFSSGSSKKNIAAAEIKPVSRQAMEGGLRTILKAWNTPSMQETLADGFRDKQRLQDSVDNIVPRDATIRLISVRGLQTLKQFERPATAGNGARRVSIVSATASTQLDYESAAGFVSLPGVNEFIIEVSEPMQP